METKRIKINNIPSIIWGEKSSKVFIAVHGNMSNKEDKVIDLYCGTGTIGLIAAEYAGEVTGVELNPEAVRNAVSNAKSLQMPRWLRR